MHFQLFGSFGDQNKDISNASQILLTAVTILYLYCICIYLFATRLQLQKDAKKNVGRNGEEA